MTAEQVCFDNKLIDYIEIRTQDPQQFRLCVALTLTEECWVKVS
jgi:hypothetical protein